MTSLYHGIFRCFLILAAPLSTFTDNISNVAAGPQIAGGQHAHVFVTPHPVYAELDFCS